MLVKETMTIPDTTATGAAANNSNKTLIFENCARFSDRMSELKNKQLDNAKDIDVVMAMYNLIEYSDI